MYVLEQVCNICRWGIPYGELAAEMKRQGFETGRIVVFDQELGGNLRRFFPDARIELVGKDAYGATLPPANMKTALLWSADRDPRAVANLFTSAFVLAPGEQLANAARIDIPWRRHLWKTDGYRMSSWRLFIPK
jgi:hypothetical protein